MPQPSRLVWRSDLGWQPNSPASSADPKNGLVIHYDSADQNLANRDHTDCIAYWNRTRDFHVSGNGWADIGYSWFCCSHGYVIEGRGLFKTQAAQRGANSTHYSATLALGPNDPITDAQIEAVRELRAWLMEPETSIDGDVFGHRDFNSTSCPGDAAYRLVQDGTFAQPPGNIKENDMPTYVSVDKTDDSRREELAPHQWQQVYFDSNNSSGAEDHHGDGDWPSLVRGPADYTGDVSLRLSDIPPGTECQARVVEVAEQDGGWAVVERGNPVEFTGSAGDTFVTIPATGFVNADRRLRVEVTHFGSEESTPTVVRGKARFQVWER